MPLQKQLILFCCPMPSFIFYKCIICPKIHTHRFSTLRATRNQLFRNFHFHSCIFRLYQLSFFNLKSLAQYHIFYCFFVIISFLMAWFTALKKPIITLRTKQPLLIESRFLKTLVYIRCQHKIIFLSCQFIQSVVYLFRCIHISVDINITAPVCPVFF